MWEVREGSRSLLSALPRPTNGRTAVCVGLLCSGLPIGGLRNAWPLMLILFAYIVFAWTGVQSVVVGVPLLNVVAGLLRRPVSAFQVRGVHFFYKTCTPTTGTLRIHKDQQVGGRQGSAVAGCEQHQPYEDVRCAPRARRITPHFSACCGAAWSLLQSAPLAAGPLGPCCSRLKGTSNLLNSGPVEHCHTLAVGSGSGTALPDYSASGP